MLPTETIPREPVVYDTPPSTGSLLTLGLSAETVRACLLEPVSGHYRLAGWLSSPRDPHKELAQQLANLTRRMGARLGRMLWDEANDEPFLESASPIRLPPLERVTAALSPRPPLRVWLAGLSAQASLAATQLALAACPVEVVGQTTVTIALNSGQLADQLSETQPEALVVVGGYDDPANGAQSALLALCKQVGQAVGRMPPGQRPVLFFAGNRYAAASATPLLRVGEGQLQLETLSNVQPAPGVVHHGELAAALSHCHWRLCQRLPGFSKVSRWLTSPAQVTSLEASFIHLVQAWMLYQQLPALHGLYCTNAWWLHVWSTQEQPGVRVQFVPPQTRPTSLADWPAVQLVCGEWPVKLWPPRRRAWWDQSGLAPLVATVGQVAPLAMLQALEHDLLIVRDV